MAESKGDVHRLNARIKELEEELNRVKSLYDKEKETETKARSVCKSDDDSRAALKRKILDAVESARVVNPDATLQEIGDLAIELSGMGVGNAIALDNYLWVAKPCRW